MTKVDDLLSGGAAEVPFDVMRAAYAELLVTDLEASRHFYVDLLGMVVAEESADAIYLRAWEERLHHSLVLRRAPAAAVSRAPARCTPSVRRAPRAGRPWPGCVRPRARPRPPRLGRG